MTRNRWAVPLSIFIFALVIRLGYAHYYYGLDYIRDGDSYQYDSFAQSILDGGGYRDRERGLRSFRVPGYPLFLAGVYKAAGADATPPERYTAVKIAQAVLSSATCLSIYYMGLQIGGAWVGVFAGLFSCVYFGLFSQPAHIMTESLFTFFFTLAVWAFLNAGRGARWAALGGLAAAAATYVRTTSLLLPAFVCLWALLKLPGRTSLRFCAVLAVCFALPLAPWAIRNHALHGKYFLSSDIGWMFLVSHHPNSRGLGMGDKLDLDYNNLCNAKYSDLGESDRTARQVADAVAWLKTQTIGEHLKWFILKIGGLLYPLFPHYDATFGWIFPFWIAGMAFAFKSRDGPALLLTAVIAMFLFGIVITSGIPRFRAPMSPIIILLGALALKNLRDRLPAPRFALIVTAWTALNALIFFFSEPLRLILRRLAFA